MAISSLQQTSASRAFTLLCPLDPVLSCLTEEQRSISVALKVAHSAPNVESPRARPSSF